MRWRQWVLIRSGDPVPSGSSDYICDVPKRPPLWPWALTRRSVLCHVVETLLKRAKQSVLHSVLPTHEL